MPGGDPEKNPFYGGYLKLFKGFIETVQNYGGFETYAEKFKKWDFPKLSSQWYNVAAPMKSGFQVLNHGDFWINNMMFRSDEDGNPLEVRLIDFQIPCWGTPSCDLFYLLILSVKDDVKINDFDEIVAFYHSEMAGALNKLNYDQQIPTLSELHSDLLDNAGFGEFIRSYVQLQNM